MLFQLNLSFRLHFAALFILVSLTGVLPLVTVPPILNLLHTELSPKTNIYLVTDPNYQSPRWSVFEEPTYFASVIPATEKDLASVVNLAARHGVPFLATSGGHGYSITFGQLENGIEIDLRQFKSVEVHAADNTVTVGGGNILEDLYDPLYNAGKEIPTGSCSCVGILGATLGGGVGRLQGLHGLIIDNLLSVKLVTGAGELITASKSQNAELFWGIRGAGFNFGIVVSATYKIADLTNGGQVMNADFIFPATANVSHFQIMQSMQNSIPPELALFTLTLYDPSLGPVIILNAVYFGSLEKGKALIQPYIDNSPLTQNITMLPWNKLVKSAGFGLNAAFCVKGERHNMYSLGVKKIDVPTFSSVFGEFVNYWKENPTARQSTMEIEHFPTQAVQAVPEGATSYPWRDINAHVMMSFAYPDSSLDATSDSLGRKIRSQINAVSGFPDLQVYVSYAHGDETLQQRYGDKLPRLQALKKKWDPKNLFAFNNGLPAR